MMLIRRKWFPLLLVGFLTSFTLAFYFVIVEKVTSFSSRRFVEMLPTIPSQENEQVPSISPVNHQYHPSSLSKGTQKASSVDSRFKVYDGVETFVMFIGYPRSSHSLVGAILDAHPEIIIPHEFNLIGNWKKYQSSELKQQNMQKYVLFRDLHERSKKQAMYGIRASANNTRLKGEFVYTYHVPGLWQGGYQNRIKVIGDKKGGLTSQILTDPSRLSVLDEIHQVVQVPMKFIHVTRNPFDNISTMMLRASGARDKVRQEGVKKNNTNMLERLITVYFKLTASNQRVRERYGDAVLDIPGHETVLRPRETIQKMCDHLGVKCSEDYFKKCSKIMYGTPSITRDKVVWTDEQIKRVTEMMKQYPFMKDYSFDKYPS